MVYLLGNVLSLAFLAFGIYRRRRDRSELDGPYLSRLVWVAVGFGMGTGAVAFPAFWVLISYTVRGGTIEDNLPSGMSPAVLLGLLLIGALMTCVYTFIGYRDHVMPFRMIEGRLRAKGFDNSPLQRHPDDLPE
jgi:hypothetical protein